MAGDDNNAKRRRTDYSKATGVASVSSDDDEVENNDDSLGMLLTKKQIKEQKQALEIFEEINNSQTPPAKHSTKSKNNSDYSESVLTFKDYAKEFKSQGEDVFSIYASDELIEEITEMKKQGDNLLDYFTIKQIRDYKEIFFTAGYDLSEYNISAEEVESKATSPSSECSAVKTSSVVNTTPKKRK